MANRNPLILDADNQRIRELPSGDNLDLTGNNIVGVRDIIPEANELYDLGSDQNRWKDLYLSGTTIIMAGGEISFDAQTGFSFTASGTPTSISLVANDTDDLSEGSTNQYFTQARARNSISVTGDLTYNSETGVLGVDVPEGYDSSDFDTDFGTKTTDNLGEGTTNLYFTTARVDSHLSGGTGVTYTAGEISIGQAVATNSDVQFNDLVVAGNLTVQGTQTVLETTTLQVEDQNIELGKVATPTNATANTGGITVLAGADVDKTWNWLSATASWTSSEHIDVASGKEYKINGNKVLDSTSLGSAVVSSSLTSVGTLNGGSISSGFGNINIGSSIFTGNGSGLTNVAAATATSLQTSRTINGVSFNGTANITVPGNFASRTTNESGHAVFIGTTATGNQSMFTNTNYRFNPSTGQLSATDFNSTSDATLKDNVIDIENALNLVSQMRGVRYTWKDNGTAGVGVIAQEMEQVLPEVVSNDGDHKSVSYGNVVGVLIEAIKELKAEVEELKKYK